MSAGSEPPARRRATLWLGDALRVAAALDVDAEAAGDVLAVLGLRSAPAPDVPASTGDVTGARPPAIAPRPGRQQSRPTAPTVREAVAGHPPPVAGAPETPVVEHLPPDPLRAQAPPRDLPRLADVLPTPTTERGRYEPLLPPQQQRAVLAALCRSRTPDGDLDLEVVVDRIARGEPVRHLPRTARATNRRGVQVLLDFGDGMRPFVQDQDEACAALERIAGPDGFEVLRFAGTPLDDPGAGPGPVWTWRPYAPPAGHRPVLVLSDLGAGADPLERPALQLRWTRFARLVRAAGNQVVALAPVPPQRLPPELRAVLPVVTWDRGTRVADAVRVANQRLSRAR